MKNLLHKDTNLKLINVSAKDTLTSQTLMDYKKEFLYPKCGISFHWWDNIPTYPHSHNYYEFFIVTKGKLSHAINGREAKLSHATLAFITPSDTHALLPITKYPIQHINIAFTEKKLKFLCDSISPYLFEIINDGYYAFILSDEDFQWFLNKANELTFSYKIGSQKDSYTIHTQILICEMIHKAISLIYKNKTTISTGYPDWFDELLKKIDAMDFTCQNINDIYSLSHYSPTTIIKYFKTYLGETIVSYVTKLKINQACNLLVTTNFSILTISNMLGYDSLSHFNRIFLQHTGQTPSEYRKQNFKISSDLSSS